MAIKIIRRDFNCKKCLKQLCGIEEELFDEAYKCQFLCVTCRKKEGKQLTPFEKMGLYAEKAVDDVK